MRNPTLLSDTEFLALADAPGKRELLDGELIERPPAKHYHSVIAAALLNLLKTGLPESRVWHEEAYHLRNGRWLVPDISVAWPDQPMQDGWYAGSPMLAIEIASRGNTGDELERKTKAYFDDGSSEVWVLHPRTRTIVISNSNGVRRILEGDAYRCELLDLTIVSDFWVPAE